jgi:hypothetical protein
MNTSADVSKFKNLPFHVQMLNTALAGARKLTSREQAQSNQALKL